MASIRLCTGLRCIAAARVSATRGTRVVRCYPSHPSVAPTFSRWQSTAAAIAENVVIAQEPQQQDSAEDFSFNSLKGMISHDTLKAITVKPFQMKTMTAVQAAVLPLLPALAQPYDPTPPGPDSPPPPPRDLLVKAKTGTGKTLAFLVPVIEARLKSIETVTKAAVKDAGLVSDKMLEARVKRVFVRTEVGALIISPTRELATQIANEALRLAHHHPDIEVRLFVGGASKRMQMRDWMKGRRDIVVATPGRLLDLLNSEPEIKKGISKTRLLVLDEADTLLDMGFRDDIELIKQFLPPNPERQNFMFSATVSREIQQIARSTLSKNHVFINTVSANEAPVHARIPQFHTVLPSAGEQIPHLLRLIAHDQLSNPGKSKIILFLPTTKMTQLFATLLRELSAKCFPSLRSSRVYEIHSKRTQESRTSTSDAFRHDGSGASILVTSDVSARGVDYPGVTRVIQVGIPGSTEQYIHRIGRTGRAGTGGRGDLVLLPWEIGFVTWQLDGVPLKPVTTNDLKSQLDTLAKAYDANPEAAFKGVHAMPADAPKMRTDARKPRMFQSPVVSPIENIPTQVEAFLPSLDEEAIKETFTSLLGYYMAKSPELRVQKGVIVQGCKDWATEACGMPVPPYVSESFLQRLGYSDGRTKRFGESFGRGGHSRGQNTWDGRGRQGLKGRVSKGPAWARGSGPLDPEDPVADPEEYKSQRYNRRPSQPPSRSADDKNSGGYGGRSGGYAERSGGYGAKSGGYGERSGGFGAKSGGYGERSGGYGARSGGERSGGYGERSGGYGERSGSYGERSQGRRNTGYGERSDGRRNADYGGGRGSHGDRGSGSRGNGYGSER